MESQQPQIQISGLSKYYVNRRGTNRGEYDPLNPGQSTLILDQIDLNFFKGELVCILGPSGCGKSTILRIIAGFDTATQGDVLINGQPVSGPSSDNIFVYQHNGLLPWCTVYENVELGLRHLENGEEKVEQIQENIDLVELSGFENYYPHQLSGGMQRRAELARALAVNPEILIMDEPFSGLDFLTHMKMREEVVNMHEYLGKTMLIVTHDIDDALIMGDRVVILSERPSTVKLNRTLQFSHPRNFDRVPELHDLRDDLYLQLGVSYVA